MMGVRPATTAVFFQDTIFTWLNIIVSIIFVSKLVQLLFETDNHLMLENDVKAHNFKIGCDV